MSETSDDFLDLADQALEDIEKMLENDVSVRPLYNRLYYAVFYSAKAGLLAKGFKPKTHRGTASQTFQKLYKQKELVEREEAILLQKLQEKRDMADYELTVNFDHQDFRKDLKQGKNFIELMKKIDEG
jgi:uncharacterized protein (UPF0332 family)